MTLITENINVAVLGHVALMENTQLLTKLSQELGVSLTNVLRILYRSKLYLYKMKLVYELHEDDFDRRVEFCEILSERFNDNPGFM